MLYGRRASWLPRSASGASRFGKLSSESRRLVFYSEGASYSKYLRPVVDEVISNEDVRVAYLTSDWHDPILTESNTKIAAFYIGSGSVRTWVFQTLRARVLIMTTPDLQTFQLKRSAVYPVHYAYLHHSLVSTHQVYRMGAFDHFDSVLCAGPHHKREIRAWEELNSLPRKELFEHGYAPLDSLLTTNADHPSPEPCAVTGLNVLLAPSWGPNGLLERGAEAIVDALITCGHRVIVRPHPMTARLSSNALRALTARFGRHPYFSLDADTTTMRALLNAHVMVSDWSGVAMEFAFGLNRPVLFIEGPRKINNPRWAEIGIRPLEELYRSEVGMLLDQDRPEYAPRLVEALWADRQMYAARAKTLSAKYVYNLGASAKAGARIIAELARQPAISPTG